MPASYITADDFSKYGLDTDNIDDVYMEALGERASRIFDLEANFTPGYFAIPTVATDRIFYGNGSTYLTVDPYVAGSITAVSLSTGWTTPTYDERDGFLAVRPIPGLFETESQGLLGMPGGYWPNNVPVTVNARWGFAAVPQDVVDAVARQAVFMYRTSDVAKLLVSQEASSSLTTSALHPLTKLVIDNYLVKSSGLLIG